MSESSEIGRAGKLAAEWFRALPRTRGGYAESVLAGWVEAALPDRPRERTSLAQLRLAYVFLRAARLGSAGAGEAAVVAGAANAALDRANEVFWRDDLRGWIRSVEYDACVDEEGAVLDETVDTYDQAFGLLALSWDREPGERGARSESARRMALAALAGLDEDASGSGGGYLERRNGSRGSALEGFPGYRRQNPHMHLLEAFLSWLSVDPEGPWRAHAASMVRLLLDRFLEPRGGYLREYFDDSWNPAPDDPERPGGRLEPGHHFEWVWLLNEYRKATGDETLAGPAKALYDFAQSKGVDADGLAFDAVDPAGNIVAGTKLLWPQTEKLKAHLAMHEWTGDEAALASARRTLGLIETLYLAGRDGIFLNQLTREGEPIPGPTPSRVLYHLFLALAEADRSGL